MPISPIHVNLAKIATNMTKSNVMLPVILLEGSVVAGRTYHAYKRGGVTEARERVLEEATGSVVWLWGALLLERVGNFVGNKFAGIKNTDFDIGRDNLRNPLNYIVKVTKNATKERYTGFKFANTVLSIGLASAFLGFVVPKINHKITNILNKSSKKAVKPQQEQNYKNKFQMQDSVKLGKPLISNNFKTMESFIKDASSVSDKQVAFKGIISPEALATLTHNLATSPIYRLGTTDTGILAGRASNARNSDEAGEIIFRDGVSSFFYLGAQPLLVKALINLDNKFIKGNSAIDPYSAIRINNFLINGMRDKKMSLQAFSDYAIGNLDKSTFEKLTFDKNDIIALSDFLKIVTDPALKNKAMAMATMQPLRDGIAILTKQQVQDVLTDGKITDPAFLKSTLNSIFGTLGTKEDIISDPTKFIPRNKIEENVTNIKAYAQSIIEYAKKHNITEITPDLMDKVTKRNIYHNFAFMATGFCVAALFLSTVIPKMQYWITQKRTGSNEFPGAKDLEK